MEPGASIETSSMIRVAVIPISDVIRLLLRVYAAMLLRHHTVSLNSISSFYTEHQKSSFAHQPWGSGSLRFKFIFGGSPSSPWKDFQSNRKILADIGICHCPSAPISAPSPINSPPLVRPILPHSSSDASPSARGTRRDNSGCIYTIRERHFFGITD
ncbi:trafficking protein particle complex II-specific subunit 120 [Salvia divinorum]|uniref:Trafficking protein particle complex II-specific subunit 120 n=1 Tax=Salvia divinorum TaxID=28513 RepID=A0ABD1HPS1_SALDI